MTRTITLIPLPELRDHPENPKTHHPTDIAASYATLGTIDLITRDDRTGYTISGHGRTKALNYLYNAGEPPPEGITVDADGTWLVPVVTGWSSKDDNHARAALVTLNTLTMSGGWDTEGLLATLEVLATQDAELLALTTFTDDDLHDMRSLLAAPSLDDLHGQVGDPTTEDTHVRIVLNVAPAVASLWYEAVDTLTQPQGRGTDEDIIRAIHKALT